MQLSQRYRMVGGSIEERGRHLWIAEHGQPLAESEVGGRKDQGALDLPELGRVPINPAAWCDEG